MDSKKRRQKKIRRRRLARKLSFLQIPTRRYVTISSRYLRFQRESGFKEEVYYLKAVGKNFTDKSAKGMNLNRRPTIQRVVPNYIIHASNRKAWKGFKRIDNYAVRWTGYMRIRNGGRYRFILISDDGSRMFIRRKLVVNNDGVHNERKVESTTSVRRSTFPIVVEYFEKTGAAAIHVMYLGPDTGNSHVCYINQNSKNGRCRASVNVPLGRSLRTPRWPPPRRIRRRRRLRRRRGRSRYGASRRMRRMRSLRNRRMRRARRNRRSRGRYR